MSRNLGQTDCEFCGGRVLIVDEIYLGHPITRDEAGRYFDEYELMIVADAECEDCHGKYLAWVAEHMRKQYVRHIDSRNDEDKPPNERFHDLSFRKAFNDEPALEDWYTVDPRIAEANRLKQRAVELEDEYVHKPCSWDEARAVLQQRGHPPANWAVCSTCKIPSAKLVYNGKRIMATHYRSKGPDHGHAQGGSDGKYEVCPGTHHPPIGEVPIGTLHEDVDQYEGSWCEAADNEGARIARESSDE